MEGGPGALSGKCVLVIEDDFIIATLIEDLLLEEGCNVFGPFGTLAAALEAAQQDCFDIALLDVNLSGEKVYPVAELLAARQIPFVFLSGYGTTAIPPDHPEWTVCHKPFRTTDLVNVLSRALANP